MALPCLNVQTLSPCRAGYDTLVYVEGLHVSGSIQAVVTLDYETPFPHVASITFAFVRK